MGFFQNLANKRSEKKKTKTQQQQLNNKLSFSHNIKKLATKYQTYSDEYLSELEEVLIASDMGMDTVLKITNQIQKKVKRGWSINDTNDYLVEVLMNLYNDPKSKQSSLNLPHNKLAVILMVGVNGAGKTTSIAKLAYQFLQQKKKILLVAGDTFRAGAVEQLEKWAEKLDIKIIGPKKANQDPASVIYDGINYAQAEKFDVVIIDTAGRLQTKINLMSELDKINRIIKREIPSAPHETLLVIDATTGQNGVSQAKNFADVTNISGIILTKMDGTAKGGIVLAIKDQLDIPVKLIGSGETLTDLYDFDIEDYIYNLTKDLFEEENS